jgi:hypothetical protein
MRGVTRWMQSGAEDRTAMFEFGEMAERSKALDWNSSNIFTGVPGFESLSLRHFNDLRRVSQRPGAKFPFCSIDEFVTTTVEPVWTTLVGMTATNRKVNGGRWRAARFHPLRVSPQANPEVWKSFRPSDESRITSHFPTSDVAL